MSNATLIAALALTLTTAACGVEPERRTEEERPLIYQHAKDIVVGSFQQDGVEIDFSFARIDDASVRMRVEASDGLVLIDTKLTGGRETTTLLGAYTFTGEAGKVSTFDTDVLAELAEMPEMQLLPGLKAALDDAGVDPALLAGLSTETTVGAIYCPPVRESNTPIGTAQTELANRN